MLKPFAVQVLNLIENDDFTTQVVVFSGNDGKPVLRVSVDQAAEYATVTVRPFFPNHDAGYVIATDDKNDLTTFGLPEKDSWVSVGLKPLPGA